VYDLQEKIDSAQSKILSLRERVNKGCFKKLALERELKLDKVV